MTKKVCYVRTVDTDQSIETLEEISNCLDIEIITTKSLSGLFFVLNDSSVTIDFVIFHLPTMFTNSECDAYGIVSTVITLAACAHPTNFRKPAVSVIIDDSSTHKQLQQILGTDIKGVIPSSNWRGREETALAITEFFAGHTYFPKNLLDKSNAQKKKNSSNEIKLTPRQAQILKLICNRGAPNKTIARMMDISESTVKLHITAILKKFGVRNRTQLALFAADSIKEQETA